MSDIAIDFTPLYVVLLLAAVAALLALPLAWWWLRDLATIYRAPAAVLAALALAGLGGVLGDAVLRDDEVALLTLGATLLLQVMVLPILLIFFRRG
ncbi:hypothetical protein [Neoroseomonas lacus]|uniref:Uncharacterized protein n=1 Tax=Neoroseomonas lacus TaxID=287609 RepID=A0A917K915_9PROT|nr:hypothetical protein [Neoroseomonas lacus]GGJ05708.1 hypothetical protein GCM10011320_10710 [Neoroseomonas lacus]